MKHSLFLINGNLALCDLDTEQIREGLRAFLAVHAMKDGDTKARFSHVSGEKKLPFTLLNGVKFLQLELYNCQTKMQIARRMSVQIALEAHRYSQIVALMSREAGRKMLNIVANVLNSPVVGMVV